jgi:hypothetical protein
VCGLCLCVGVCAWWPDGWCGVCCVWLTRGPVSAFAESQDPRLSAKPRSGPTCRRRDGGPGTPHTFAESQVKRLSMKIPSRPHVWVAATWEGATEFLKNTAFAESQVPRLSVKTPSGSHVWATTSRGVRWNFFKKTAFTESQVQRLSVKTPSGSHVWAAVSREGVAEIFKNNWSSGATPHLH